MHRHLCNAEIRLAISMWSDNIAYMHYCCIHWPMCDVLLKTSWRSSLSLSLSLCVCVCWAHPFLLPPSLLFSRSFSPFPVLTFLRVAGDNGMLMVCNVLELLTVSNWVFSSFQWKNETRIVSQQLVTKITCSSNEMGLMPRRHPTIKWHQFYVLNLNV